MCGLFSRSFGLFDIMSGGRIEGEDSICANFDMLFLSDVEAITDFLVNVLN